MARAASVCAKTGLNAGVPPDNTENLYRTTTVFAIREDVASGLANRGFPPFRIQPRLARPPTLTTRCPMGRPSGAELMTRPVGHRFRLHFRKKYSQARIFSEPIVAGSAGLQEVRTP